MIANAERSAPESLRPSDARAANTRVARINATAPPAYPAA